MMVDGNNLCGKGSHDHHHHHHGDKMCMQGNHLRNPHSIDPGAEPGKVKREVLFLSQRLRKG